jgi:hypothetical protein
MSAESETTPDICDTPDVSDDVIRAVAAEMSGHGLRPLSDEEREQRRIENELWRWECQQREEQRRFEYEQQQAIKAEAAGRDRRIAAEAARQKANRELRERDRERQREREIFELRLQTAQQRGWMNNVENAARAGLVQAQRRTLMDELERMINPPQPPPEPEPEYIEPEEERGICGIKPVRWR